MMMILMDVSVTVMLNTLGTIHFTKLSDIARAVLPADIFMCHQTQSPRPPSLYALLHARWADSGHKLIYSNLAKRKSALHHAHTRTSNSRQSSNWPAGGEGPQVMR